MGPNRWQGPRPQTGTAPHAREEHALRPSSLQGSTKSASRALTRGEAMLYLPLLDQHWQPRPAPPGLPVDTTTAATTRTHLRNSAAAAAGCYARVLFSKYSCGSLKLLRKERFDSSVQKEADKNEILCCFLLYFLHHQEDGVYGKIKEGMTSLLAKKWLIMKPSLLFVAKESWYVCL